MQITNKTLALGAVVVLLTMAAAIAGAYWLGRAGGLVASAASPSAASQSAASPNAASPNVASPATEPSSSMRPPPNHPPVSDAAAAAAAANASPALPEREGKVVLDPQAKFVHFRVGNRNVKDILADGPVVWVGTSGGVIRYDTRSDRYELLDSRSGLLSNGVFHVSRLDGRLAVGTYGGGLSLLDEKSRQWQTFNIPEGLGDAFVYDVLKTKAGDTWIATWSGVNRVRGGKLTDRSRWELHTVDSTQGGLPNDWVYALAEGKNGEVWLATEGGLARYVNGRWDHWSHKDGLGAPYEKVKNDLTFKNDPSKVSSHHAKQKQEMGLQGVDTAYNPNYIVSLAVDGDGAVWAGTWGGGLSRFDGKGWTHYTVAEGLPGNHVFMLHIDPKGRLWIGTNNGLARREGDRFVVLTTQDGLFSNTVFSMATGADGSLWVGSFGGVSHLIAPR